MNKLSLFGLAFAMSAPFAASIEAAPATAGKHHGGKVDGKHMGRGKHGGGMRMAGELGLTEAQRTKMKAIMMASRDKRKALRNKKLTEAERRTQMRAIGEQTRAQIVAMLTPAQKKKMAEMRNQRHEKMKARGEKPTRM
ncbi:MAG TPA: Spy/CpxP family protein refolding chaperone [Abditibacteriaceae bacterium]